MGIQGLFTFLDPIIIKEHISSFANKTAVIDIMAWIYKGCYRCAIQLNQSIQTKDYLYFIFEMINLLSYYKIKPICVFDGNKLDRKLNTLEKRKKLQQKNRQKGLAYLKDGDEQRARKYLSRCIIVNEQIIKTTMRALFTKNIQFIVSPYESDAQMTKMIRLGDADFVITEDSDIIVYGVKTVTKLNQNGQCNFIDLNLWVPEDVDGRSLKQYLKMDYIQRIEAAILAGTDYNESIKRIGIRKAIKLLSEYKTMDKAIQHLRKNKNYQQKIPENYEKIVMDSKLIFLFATTFNTRDKKLQFLNKDLLKDYLSQTITEEYIKSLVGEFYNYNDDCREGRFNIQSLENRQIFSIQVPDKYSLNTLMLKSKEVENMERRIHQLKMKQKRLENIFQRTKNGNNLEDVNEEKSQRRSRNKMFNLIPEQKLTQQQQKIISQEKLRQRQKRFIQFKSILQSLQFTSKSNDSEEDFSEDSKFFDDSLKKGSQTTQIQNHASDGNGQADNQCQISGLSCLNPFPIKEDQQNI